MFRCRNESSDAHMDLNEALRSVSDVDCNWSVPTNSVMSIEDKSQKQPDTGEPLSNSPMKDEDKS